MLRIETFVAERDQLGEGPLWDERAERFYWIDSYGPTLQRCDLKGGDRKTWDLPEPIGSFALREQGRAGAAQRLPFPRRRERRGQPDQRDTAGRAAGPPQ